MTCFYLHCKQVNSSPGKVIAILIGVIATSDRLPEIRPDRYCLSGNLETLCLIAGNKRMTSRGGLYMYIDHKRGLTQPCRPKPITAQRPKYRRFDQNFNFNLRRDPQKNFQWVSRLWVGRRKEPILSYATKNDEKKNPGTNGLREGLYRVVDLKRGSI